MCHYMCQSCPSVARSLLLSCLVFSRSFVLWLCFVHVYVYADVHGMFKFMRMCICMVGNVIISKILSKFEKPKTCVSLMNDFGKKLRNGILRNDVEIFFGTSNFETQKNLERISKEFRKIFADNNATMFFVLRVLPPHTHTPYPPPYRPVSCNGAIVSDTEGGDIVQMSGDQRTNIHEFLVDQQICVASQVIMRHVAWYDGATYI